MARISSLFEKNIDDNEFLASIETFSAELALPVHGSLTGT
jgi:hypothetical protein